MLVVISDLHFVDETVGKHNLPARAYERVLSQLDVVERFQAERIKDVELLLLGDIFDVIRTNEWLDTDIRPWGSLTATKPVDDPAVLDETRRILDGIIGNLTVAGACAAIRAWKERLEDHDVPVRISYVPGNHDRFLHVDPDARATVRRALAVDGAPAAPFERTFADEDHHVTAFHGHEMDLFNFGDADFRSDAPDFIRSAPYGQASVGEAITIDIASALPTRVSEQMQHHHYDLDEIEKVRYLLNNLDNVRPIGAIFPWLRHVAGQLSRQINETGRAPLLQILDDVVEAIFDRFAAIPFVVDWSQAVDQGYIPDSAGGMRRSLARLVDLDFHEYVRRIDDLADAEEIFASGVGTTDTGWDRYQHLRKSPFYDQVVEPAFRSFNVDRVRYMVYGHTHIPEVVPIAGDTRETMLLNTGTFRPRVVRCGDPSSRRGTSSGYVNHKTLSYAVFYRDEEEPRGQGQSQRYEMWQGVLHEA